jgi:tetratricopeptide (TPR) repeat protein
MRRQGHPRRGHGAALKAGLGWLAVALALAPAAARAGFLDSSEPAQAAAMGGNLVALQDEPSGVFYNPAALGVLDQFLLSARYAQLFAGLDNDNLSTGGLEAMAPLGGLGALALSWDHFSGDYLQQDRFQTAWGRGQETPYLGHWDLGLSLAYLRQAYTLASPLAGVDLSQMDSQAFSMGGGLAWKPWPWILLGFSGQDINQPNLGVLGPALVPVTWRWGLGLRSGPGSLGAAELTVAQSMALGQIQTQVGAQWEPWDLGLAVRTGLAPNEGSVGLGWALGPLRLDYAYLFSIGADASLGGSSLPANHWFELSYAWTPAGTDRWLDKAREAGRRGDWAQALWFYGNALEGRPDDPALKRERDQASAQYQALRSRQYYQAGVKAQAQGSLAEARIDFQWARQANPSDPAAAEALGALDAQQPKGALADPRVQSVVAEALALKAQGLGGEALARLDQAAAWYPGDASLTSLRRVFEAQTRAAGPAPLSPKAEKRVLALQHEAESYESQGHRDLARQAWQKILVQDPDNPEARERLKPSGVRVSGASPAQRKRSETLFNQGLGAYESGDIPGAIQFWEQAVQADPDNLNARNNLVRARIETENSQP